MCIFTLIGRKAEVDKFTDWKSQLLSAYSLLFDWQQLRQGTSEARSLQHNPRTQVPESPSAAFPGVAWTGGSWNQQQSSGLDQSTWMWDAVLSGHVLTSTPGRCFIFKPSPRRARSMKSLRTLLAKLSGPFFLGHSVTQHPKPQRLLQSQYCQWRQCDLFDFMSAFTSKALSSSLHRQVKTWLLGRAQWMELVLGMFVSSLL